MRARNTILDYFRILLGVTLMASGITVFFQPNGIVTGGVSGLSIIVSYYVNNLFSIDIPLSVLNIIFNLPLLVLGFIVLGKSIIWRTLIATLYFSLALAISDFLPNYVGDYVIVCVFGGALMGAGIGLAISGYATTGGSDLCASIIHKKFKNISVANAILIIDSAVIAVGFVAFGIERGLYAIISVYISSKVIDGILEGLNFSKGAFIISSMSSDIAADIMHTLERGVTGLNGRGMYTEENMNVLMCIVAKKEIITLKDIVKKHDPDAFMIITDVRETLGKGFTEEL